MPGIPHTEIPDSTLAFLADPYRYIAATCARLGTDVFATRLLLVRTICMRGGEAAELFCDPNRFVRSGAMPSRIQKSLLGRGGVQGLDGHAHLHRKAMFMEIAAPTAARELAALAAEQLRAAARTWIRRDRVELYAELQQVLTRAVCAWAGIPLEEWNVGRRTAELTAMFDRAASIGPPRWRARRARARAERWCTKLIEDVRAEGGWPDEDGPLFLVAHHRGLDGSLLDGHTAAVELLNLLRPVVAVSVFIVFAAHALHERPELRERIATDRAFAEAFANEVRRFYPFFPSAAARIRRDFEWRGGHFTRGTRVLLDLHGTNRDPRLWDDPDVFRPERFLGAEIDPFRMIPQGPGDPHVHHRCPGERIAVQLIATAARFFATEILYAVPPQDLRLDWRRVPALPRSRFILSNVAIPPSRALAGRARPELVAPL